MINVEKVKPTGIFTNYIYKAIPLAFDESMSYYECLCGLLNYLKNTVMPALNNNADAIIELQEFCVELKNYVDHYFDNLDVQEEINNKLDDMAEQGQLTDIIAQYLQLAGVLAFNTIDDMSNAENIDNGSICYCLGDQTYNDGKGGYYKIRSVTVDDTIDGFNIVELDISNTLIAERMPNYYINEINNSINTLGNSINDLDDEINKNHVLIIGDSWSTYQAGFTKWYQILENNTGYIIDNYAVSGAGFYHCDVANTTFAEQIASANGNVDPDTLKYIIVYGGVNDYRNGITSGQLAGGMQGVVYNAKQYFPKAQLVIIPLNIGYANNSIYNGFSKYRTNVIHDALSQNLGVGFCQTASFWLMPYGSGIWTETEGEKLHPTENGHKIICSYILSILNGTYDGVHNVAYYGDPASNDNYIRVAFDNGLLNICGSINNAFNGTTGSITVIGGLNTYLFGTSPSNFFGTGTAVDGNDCIPFFIYLGQDGNISVEGRVSLAGKICIINSTFNS